MPNLRVRVEGAEDIATTNEGHSPFARIQVKGDHYVTVIIENNRNPIWEKDCDFPDVDVSKPIKWSLTNSVDDVHYGKGSISQSSLTTNPTPYPQILTRGQFNLTIWYLP